MNIESMSETQAAGIRMFIVALFEIANNNDNIIIIEAI